MKKKKQIFPKKNPRRILKSVFLEFLISYQFVLLKTTKTAHTDRNSEQMLIMQFQHTFYCFAYRRVQLISRYLELSECEWGSANRSVIWYFSQCVAKIVFFFYENWKWKIHWKMGFWVNELKLSVANPLLRQIWLIIEFSWIRNFSVSSWQIFVTRSHT
jgi:hypothetical protein